jgi:hypothetical protein
MELLNFIFRLGVVFAIYDFIWAIIEIGLSFLRLGAERTSIEIYFIKCIKYVLLVDVTFLFCFNLESNNILVYNLGITGMVLLSYFVGKIQKQQQRIAVMNMIRSGLNAPTQKFDIKGEIAVIMFSMTCFVLLIFYPQYSHNSVSVWFHESILNIEDTPIFGFIFKVVGFFFLMNLLVKMINGFMYLVTGRPLLHFSSSFKKYKKDKDDEDFHDYEELK